MCDTMVCLSSWTNSNTTIFAKNSDREPLEAQAINILPRRVNEGATLQTTFISLPQVKESFACILSRPFQMWGAEMGVNEHGVVIGNEAVFTKVKIKKNNSGLTGMDLLRLALERSKTAKEAKDNIIQLLETYGQDACGGYKNKSFYYHNSFIIADAKDGYVLETAGKFWAVEHIKTIRSISNNLSITNNYNEISPNIKSKHKVFFDQREKDDKIDFSATFSDWLYTTVGRGKKRAACSSNLIAQLGKSIIWSDFIKILSIHHLPEGEFTPKKANTSDICMHATNFLNPSSTTGSMIVEISESKTPNVWVTGTSHPCMAIYFPIFFDMKNYDKLLEPKHQTDDSLWWNAQRAFQIILKNYDQMIKEYSIEKVKLQREIIQEFSQKQMSSQEKIEFCSRWIKKIDLFYKNYHKK